MSSDLTVTGPGRSGRSGRSRGSSMLLATALLAALAARLAFLGSKSLWADEAYVSGLTSLPLGEAMHLFSEGTPHPGGGMAFLWLSARLFGWSEEGLRLLGALFTASAAAPLFLFLRRRTGTAGAFWATLCWALSPLCVSLGQEAWIYGPMAALSFWAVYSADLAWRGSIPALAGFVAASAAGVLVQSMFLLTVAASAGLYFTLPRTGRTGTARLVSALAAVLAASVPVLLPLGDEMAGRSARMAASGASGHDLPGLLRGSLSAATRLIPGGLLPESWRLMASAPRYLAAFAAGLSVQAVSFAATIRKPRDARLLIWMATVFALPFLVFLVDEPSARQFPLAWLAFTCTLAFASSRLRWFGPASSAVCLALLAGYYGMTVFPYHRSDYRSAAASVDSGFSAGDAVVLTGARSMTQAWSFYSRSGAEVLDTTGGNPYLSEEESEPASDPVRLADSLLSSGRRVWVVQDYWGGPAISDLIPRGIPVPQPAGSTIRVVRVEPGQTQAD